MLMKQQTVSIALAVYSVLMVTTSHAAFGQVAPSQCQFERVKLQLLGTRGPELLAGDNQASTGYLLWLDNLSSG
jgi:endonuclease/exonuclease/phosphatase (EEP) superfamily protein YafD